MEFNNTSIGINFIFPLSKVGTYKTVLSAQGEDFMRDAFWNLNRKTAHSH